MAQQTVEQLREEAARQQGLATASKAKLDKEKITLQQQQSELRKIQSDIVALGQAASGAAAPAQQQIANSIIILEQRKSRLQQTINQTNNRINALATETVNYENTASQLNQQADTLAANQLNPPQPPPAEEGSIEPSVGKVSATPIFGNPDIEVDIAPPLQSNRIVDPDTGVIIQPLSNITSHRPTPTVPYGPSRDDDGNLLPGWEEGELGDQFVGPDYISSSIQASANASRGLSINRSAAQGAQSNNNVQSQETLADWRVKLSLAEGQDYLYQSPQPGILSPLAATKGVIFPYVPAVTVNYTASYDATDLTHSNYKIFSYRQSSVDGISIVGDFTAQDTAEANYLLAVIHFFRSVTKMFYGKDNNPKPGTPPPLCFLTGLGTFQFDNHPLVITNFSYTLPTDVDYIRAGFFTNTQAGVSQAPNNTNSTPSAGSVRLPGILKPGGVQGPPQWKTAVGQAGQPSYVPTKMQINIQALPVVTRNDISNNFSLKDYASGKIYSRGNKSRGIW
jgi:multidrug efflux pump subunit AcrA (membrane-fusion protein)